MHGATVLAEPDGLWVFEPGSSLFWGAPFHTLWDIPTEFLDPSNNTSSHGNQKMSLHIAKGSPWTGHKRIPGLQLLP